MAGIPIEASPHFASSPQQTVASTYSHFHTHSPRTTAQSFVAALDPSLQALDSDNAYNTPQPYPGLNHGSIARHQVVVQQTVYSTDNERLRPLGIRALPSQFSLSAIEHQHAQFSLLGHKDRIPDSILQPNGTYNLEHSPAEPPGGTPSHGKKDAHFTNMKFVPDPPNLSEWRERLFNVEGVLTLTEDEFQTYFPHIDNVYSHRSTQKYKRARPTMDQETTHSQPPSGYYTTQEEPQQAGFHSPSQSRLPGEELPADDDQRFYTIQRVNGNGGNGKIEGIAGPHKHSLEESDRIKKSTIARKLQSEVKAPKDKKKTYHKKATGTALNTVKRHSKEHELKLFGSCFCPFVQRVWIAMELKDMQYQYIEVDPYKKPQQLLDVNPRGLVPALRHGDWGCHESTVLMEYLEDMHPTHPLLPTDDPKKRAHSRLWTDHINRKIVPAFYHYLQAQEAEKQIENAKELKDQLEKLIDAADPAGPFFLGPNMTFVDVQIAPWILRMSRVLKPYRAWPDPEESSRFAKWVDAIESNVGVRATTSTDELYIDSYERYAENRPDTSQVANAVNSGKGLP